MRGRPLGALQYVNHYAQLRATEFASSLPFLRVGIKTGGCGLFEYDIKLDAELADDDMYVGGFDGSIPVAAAS